MQYSATLNCFKLFCPEIVKNIEGSPQASPKSIKNVT